jgi:anion-transporting  ArsA/GET3 family ATPase
MAYKENKEEEKTLERAQRDAKMVSEYAKDARNRSEAEKSSNNLEDEIESKEYTVENILDETRNNIRNTTKETQREIPQYTRIIDDMLQTTIKIAREITDSYIESQKDIIKVYQSIWAPHIENVSRFWGYWWVYPKNSLDIWKRSS